MKSKLLAHLGLGLKAYRETFVFRGRSTRTEVLSFAIVAALIGGAGMVILALFDLTIDPFHALDTALNKTILTVALKVALFLPIVALLFRRAHDFNWSGWPSALVGTAVLALGLLRDLDFIVLRAQIYPDWLEFVRGLSTLGFYATVLWAPSRGTNRFGLDPRLDDPALQMAAINA